MIYTTNIESHLHSNPYNLIIKKPEFFWPIGTLDFDVYAKERAGTEKQKITIAFRGSDPELGDWFSNLRWITWLLLGTSDQYDQTQAYVDIILNALDDKFESAEGIDLYTTGHSLGGGLAQQFAYALKGGGTQAVFAFDSSSVTGFYDVDDEITDVSKKGLKIFRIYEHGETLAYLRLGMKFIYPVSTKDPEIIEVRYNFANEDKLNIFKSVEEHSMFGLACALKRTHTLAYE